MSVCLQAAQKTRQFYCHDSRGHGTKVIGHMVLITRRLKKRVPVFCIAQLLVLDRISWWGLKWRREKTLTRRCVSHADLMELVTVCLHITNDYCNWRKLHNSKYVRTEILYLGRQYVTFQRFCALFYDNLPTGWFTYSSPLQSQSFSQLYTGTNFLFEKFYVLHCNGLGPAAEHSCLKPFLINLWIAKQFHESAYCLHFFW